jgi:hypothetical protein
MRTHQARNGAQPEESGDFRRTARSVSCEIGMPGNRSGQSGGNGSHRDEQSEADGKPAGATPSGR